MHYNDYDIDYNKNTVEQDDNGHEHISNDNARHPEEHFEIKDHLPPIDKKGFKVTKYTMALTQIARRVNQQLLRQWNYQRRLTAIRMFGYKNEESKKNMYYKKKWVEEYKKYVDSKVNRRMSQFYPPDQVNELVHLMGRKTEEMNKQNKRIGC